MQSSEHCTHNKKAENPNPCLRLMSMTCCGPRNLDTRIEYDNFWTIIRQRRWNEVRFYSVDEKRFNTLIFRSQSSAKTRPRRLNLWVTTLRGVSKQISLVITRSLSSGLWSNLWPLDDLRFANKLLQEAKESSDGLFFKSGLFTWNKMEMLTITDASFGNKSNFCSQKRADDFSHWT